MDKVSQDKKDAQSKQAMAAVAATQKSQQIILASENGAINVLSIGGNGVGKKDSYKVTKNADGTYKVHSASTNTTTNVATVCPSKKNETISTCVALTYNYEQTQVLSTKNVTFNDQHGTGFNVVSVTDLILPTQPVQTPADANKTTD